MITLASKHPLHTQAGHIFHENLHEPLPVKCIIGPTEVDEDFIKDIIPRCRQLMEQFGFEGGGTRPLFRSEPMQYVVEAHRCPDSMVENTQHCLPNYFY